MKKNIAFLLLISILNFGLSQTASIDLSSLVKKVENSVFIIYTFNKDNQPISQGSGFFINSTGIGVTNYHVLSGCSSAIIKTKSGKKIKIKSILDFDKQTDLVKFKIENTEGKIIQSVALTNIIPKRGGNIFNIGNPLGLEQTVSSGIISSIREITPYGDLIQITAPISQGSSGSPIFNLKGEVIGVATMGLARGQNLNFAVPTKQINKLNRSLNKQLFELDKSILLTENYEKANEEYVAGNIEQALQYLNKELIINPKNHLALNLKGNIQLESEDYEGAIESLFYASRLDTTNAVYLTNFGLANAKYGYSLKGDLNSFQAAYVSYSKALEIDPKYEIAYVNKAWLIYNNINSKKLIKPILSEDRIYEALENLNNCIELNQYNSRAYSLRAEIKFKLKDTWNSLKDIDKAISFDDENFDFYMVRAEIKCIGLNDCNSAIKDLNIAYDKAIENKSKADVLGLRSIAKNRLGLTKEACEDAKIAYRVSNDKTYKKLIETVCENEEDFPKSQNDKNIYFEKAIELYKENRNNEALKQLELSIIYFPNQAKSHFLRGYIFLYEIKNPEKAVFDFNKYIELEKDNENGYLHRGFAYINLEKYFLAILDFTKVISINNKNTDAYFLRGLSKSKINDRTGAISDYDIILSKEKADKSDFYNFATVYNNKAYCLLELNKPLEALPLVNKALDLNKSTWFIWDTRGEIYYKLGQYDLAIKDLNRAIQIDENSNSFYIRGLSKIKLGQIENGCTDLTKAVELGKTDAYEFKKQYCK